MATVLLNQASFNNWLAGGQSSISGNAGFKYDLNYKSDTWTWDNKLTANYGLTKINGQTLQKTDDRFEFNSLLGKKASGEWYYSGFFNFKHNLILDLIKPINRLRFRISFHRPIYSLVPVCCGNAMTI